MFVFRDGERTPLYDVIGQLDGSDEVSYNSRLRDEFLNVELFSSLAEARVLGEERRNYYNQFRPHSSLGGQSPAKHAIHSSVPVGAPPLPPPNYEQQEPKQNLS